MWACVPSGLPLHGLSRDQPAKRRFLGRHIERRVERDVDVLTSTRLLLMEHGGDGLFALAASAGTAVTELAAVRSTLEDVFLDALDEAEAPD